MIRLYLALSGLTMEKQPSFQRTKDSKEPHLSDITQPFELPPSGNTVIDFVNELGYPEPVEIVSNIRVNYVYQPWRAILSLINQADMGRVYSRDPDIFLTQSKSQSQSEEPKEESNSSPHLYGMVFQGIIYYLASNNNIYRRPDSAVHHTGDDYILGNLKLSLKKTPQESASVQPATNAQHPKSPQHHTHSKQSKPAPPPSKEIFQALEAIKKIEEEGNDADLERAIKLSLDPAFLPQGRAPSWRSNDQGPSTKQLPNCMKYIKWKRPLSAAPKGDKDQDEVDTSTVTSGVSIPVFDPEKAHEALAGPDPEPMKEDQTGSDSGKLHRSHLLCRHYWSLLHQSTHKQTITTSLPEITPFIALQLRVARLEQEMSEVKKTDHSTDVLASIRSQVPTAVDKYLGTKLDDALLKVLERHTADLIEKYSALPGPESIQNQESEKSPKEIIRTKKEQGEEKQDSTYSIRSTDKVDLEEFDLKTLIADEDAMDKEVTDKVKDHKRKHDSDDDEDDDDDEGPSAGSNQGRSTKKRRSDSAASGSAKPPPKDDDQSSKKPRESEASASKQHPALTSTGWQITDTREAGVDSSMHRSDPESEHSEQSSDDISMQDEGNDSDMEDTDNAHIPKVSTTTWFKPIPESERPATPEPEWTIPPNDFPEPENNWANTYATTYKDPEENKLQRKTYDIGSFIKWFCRRTGKKKLCKADLEGPAFNLVKAFHKNSVFLQYQMDECHKLLSNKVDLHNPEGHQILRNVYEPLPLGGPPGQVTIQPQFFFNKDLDYLLTGDKERRIALSISKLKAARYLDFGLEELVPSLWVESELEYDISAVYGITHWWFRRKEFYINKHSEPSDREAVRSQMRILSVISVKVFEKYGYNYLREIILRRADYQEYKISEKDFKNLHPNDFEDLFLLNIQEKLNHLPKTDKTSLHTAVNMWIRNLFIVNGTLNKKSWENWTKCFKDFHLFRVNKGMETRSGQRMTREEAKTSSQLSRKDYRSEGSIESIKLHPSETIGFHNEDGILSRAPNIKQSLGYRKDGDGDGNSQFLDVK
ncbi:hypothetical protein Tco_1121689 [Tanacetum coccineum]|uniref:Uncharacterized protein n=1 Tax=Tanacetum coccineum TaxID=301880 RepID=A0ABQ5IYE3_9ASTR